MTSDEIIGSVLGVSQRLVLALGRYTFSICIRLSIKHSSHEAAIYRGMRTPICTVYLRLGFNKQCQQSPLTPHETNTLASPAIPVPNA